MKLGRWLSTAALSFFLATFLFGTTGLLQAQDQRDESKPAQPEAAKPDSSRPQDAKPSKEQDAKQQDEGKQNADHPARNDDKATRQEDMRPQNEKGADARGEQSNQAERMQGNKNDNRGRIPDDKFRANFGRQHTFVMRQPSMVQGRPTFQYGGYSFTLVDAWPAGWAYTDQCYIDYIDGEYFLFDLAHPGVRLALVVVM